MSTEHVARFFFVNESKSPLLRFTGFYVFAGLAAISAAAFLAGAEGAEYVLISWMAAGIPLLMIVFGRLNREQSPAAQLLYLVGLAVLALVAIVGLYRLWPLIGL